LKINVINLVEWCRQGAWNLKAEINAMSVVQANDSIDRCILIE